MSILSERVTGLGIDGLLLLILIILLCVNFPDLAWLLFAVIVIIFVLYQLT